MPQMPAKKTVLVIDDDHDVRAGAHFRLRAAGYNTIEARDGEAGVAMAVEQHPDAVLLDVRMPHMDGLKALTELHEDAQTADIPIIMLSASVVDQQAALDGGARFFLPKPYRSSELLEAVAAAIHAPASTTVPTN